MSLTLTAPVSIDHVLESDSDFGLLQDNDAAAVTNSSTENMASTFLMPPDNDFMQGVLGGTMILSDFEGFIEFDQDPMLGDIDLSFLNNTRMNPAQPFSAEPPTSSVSETGPISTSTGVVAEAYRRSRVHRGWEPGKEGNQEIEHQNLNLPHNTGPECLESSSPEMATMVKKPLSLSMRDRILGMILRTASSQAAERVVASFPSLEVLGDLINFAFVRMADLQAIPVIHMPSLDLNEQRPELLAAFIAYGSISSPSPALRKFGYAIQETVRIAINQLVSIMIMTV